MVMSRKLWGIGVLALGGALLLPHAASAVIITYYPSGGIYNALGMSCAYDANGRTYSDSRHASMGVGLGSLTISSYLGGSHAGGTGGASTSLAGSMSNPTVSAYLGAWGDSSGTEYFSSQVDFVSGNAVDGWPGPWTVYVLPSGGEVAGTPVTVTITADIAGSISSSGNATTAASWSIDTSRGSLLDGSATNGSFSDSDVLQFGMVLGSAFTMDVDVLASALGSGTASGNVDISSLNIAFSAQLGSTVIPEPASLAIWSALGIIGIVVGARRRKRVA